MQQVVVEVHRMALERTAAGGPPWSLESREDADHSTPYLVAVALRDGTVTLASFSDAHLWNPELRELMLKVRVVEDEDFTHLYQQLPQQNRARVTVVTHTGLRLIGEEGGDADDLAAPKSDAQISEKFRTVSVDCLGATPVNSILERLWNLEKVTDVAVIPPLCAIT